MLPQEIIRKVRDNKKLNKEEISFFMKGVASGQIADVQAASFTMAVFLNGISDEETLALTLAMRDSGERLYWDITNGPILDKHSTGGVGDKVSLMLAPILAALGAYVPMIAGRGLGHTGGTLDKLDSILGYQTSVSPELFQKTVKEVGCAIVGQTSSLAPADKKLYAIRDVSATVESIPLITASILAKKLAAGLKYLVMDIKCGNGAFMENQEQARKLAHSIVNVANGAGTKTTALLTDMNSVLGSNVGNALELIEALDYLKAKKPNEKLKYITETLCKELLINSSLVRDEEEAINKINEVISSGKAYEHFIKMAALLGADTKILENFSDKSPKAKYIKPIYANKSGYIKAMDTREIGLAVIVLGGGRITPEQKINYTTGFSSFCQVGDKVDKKTPLCYIHAEDEDKMLEAENMIKSAITISGENPKKNTIILEKIS